MRVQPDKTRKIDMRAISASTPLLTDRDVDQFAWQFLRSDYVEDIHANWPLERRLEGFLRNRGLARLADDGDVCTIILDRVTTYLGQTHRRVGGPIAPGRSAPSECSPAEDPVGQGAARPK